MDDLQVADAVERLRKRGVTVAEIAREAWMERVHLSRWLRTVRGPRARMSIAVRLAAAVERLGKSAKK